MVIQGLTTDCVHQNPFQAEAQCRGGFAGVAYLAQQGYFRRDAIDYVVITEPLDDDRICLGPRGVYWFEVAPHGRTAHGSIPFLGMSTSDGMARCIHRIERELKPRLAERITVMPVEPAAVRTATINLNAIIGGPSLDAPPTPCVADLCRAIFDRRFLLEENFNDVRDEILTLLGQTVNDMSYTLKDLMIVHPRMTPPTAVLVATLTAAIDATLGRQLPLIASPGTYDQKYFARIAGIEQCVAYGPGILQLAHQPDEYCEIEHLALACKTLALAALRLVGDVLMPHRRRTTMTRRWRAYAHAINDSVFADSGYAVLCPKGRG